MKKLTSVYNNLFMHHGHIKWALLDQTMVSGINFLIGILLARYLGMTEFGVFTLTWMAVLFSNSLQEGLVVAPMMSIGAKQEKKNEPYYFGSVLIQQVFVAASSSIVIFYGVKIFVYIYPDVNVGHLAFPLSSAAFAFQMQDYFRRYFFTRSKPESAFFNDVICYGGKLFLFALLVYFGMVTIVNTIWIITLSSFLAVLFSIANAGKHSFRSVEYIKSNIFEHWQFSRWFTASILASWMSGHFLTIAAGASLGAWAVGALKAAQNIMGITNILFSGMENSVPIRASRKLHSQGITVMEAYLRKAAIYGGILLALIVAPVLLFPEQLLTLIYGNEYEDYGWVLSGFALLSIVLYTAKPFIFGLRAIEQTSVLFIASISMAITSILVAYPLSKTYGLYGVMIGLMGLAFINLFVVVRGYMVKRFSIVEES